eukprot:gene16812-biopygen3338
MAAKFSAWRHGGKVAAKLAAKLLYGGMAAKLAAELGGMATKWRQTQSWVAVPSWCSNGQRADAPVRAGAHGSSVFAHAASTGWGSDWNGRHCAN